MDVFTLERTPEWDAWFGKLRDQVGKRAILTRLARLQITGHWGDAEPVGDGITEIRIHVGPGYRVYCKQTGKTIVLLLNGGDKDSQARDIRRAKEIAARA